MRGDSDKTDVIVIGGGPAGSTTAALLSEKGWRVTLLEKARHPRFHIGESLLPGNMRIFERLGVMDDLERIGVVKSAIDFTLPSGNDHVTFDFSRVETIPHKTAFQVRRSDLDHMLLRNAANKGVRIIEGVDARAVEFDGDHPVRIESVDEDGHGNTWTAEFLIDASGRNTFLADHLGLKVRNRRHNSAAMFAHFEGAERRQGWERGNISVYWFDHGWFWLIPLKDGITSVGAVTWPRHLKSRHSSIDRFFLDTIATCPPLAKRLGRASLVTPVTATGNYSYTSRRMYGDRYLMIGDAFGFIDPVFSSGVYLAMFGGALGADTVDMCLRQPSRKRSHLRRHARIVRRGMKQLSWFIYRFTSPAMRKMFMNPRNLFRVQDAVVTLLAGDVFYNRRNIALRLFKMIYYLLTLTNPKWARNTDLHDDSVAKRKSVTAEH